jgi:hypothetical protein
MNEHLTAAVARERRLDLQRAAGCCSALLEHRRALKQTVGRRLSAWPRRPTQPLGCCA